MLLATTQEMREAERLAAVRYHISESTLMESAGTNAALFLLKRFPNARKIAVVCGRGKNGGDGRVAVRSLQSRRRNPSLISTEKLPPSWREVLKNSDLIVDALFGTGLSREVGGREKEIVAAINASGKKVVSFDIPSGLSADTGRILGSAVRADFTLTMGIPKVGLFIGEGPERAGEVVTIDIGIPKAVYDKVDPKGRLIAPDDFRPLLVPRRSDTHKGTYGHLLVVGGSINRLGAPLLTCRAALKTGVGLVSLGLPDRCYQKIPRGLMEVMYEPLPSDRSGRLSSKGWGALKKLIGGKSSVAIGPGLGVSPEIKKLLQAILGYGTMPILIDADALNALGDGGRRVLRAARRPVVLTPHPGEMGRLIGKTTAFVQKDRLGAALQFAREARCLLILKGFRTLVVTGEGRYFVNPTGNPAMASAGMGDVLTGILGAFLSHEGIDPLMAALAAVYLHGRAGDRLKERLGDRGLTASDLIEEIPPTLKPLVQGK